MNKQNVAEYLTKLRKKHPLVHCITNIVTVTDCANALLAIGASPTMAHHEIEVAEITEGCDSLVLNLGATECFSAMELAGKRATECEHPIVLDPVGVSGSKFRREFAIQLLNRYDISLIRGNYSEIKALAYNETRGAGVDVLEEDMVSNMLDQLGQKKYEVELAHLVKSLAKKYNTIVCASGEIDYISDGIDVYLIRNGVANMPRVTGSGCMSSSLCGAFMTISKNVDAVIASCVAMGIAGELAQVMTEQESAGIGTYHVKLLDALDLISDEDILKRIKVEQIK